VRRATSLVAGVTLMLAMAACSSATPAAPASAPSSAATPTPTRSAPPARPAFGAYLDISVSTPDLAALATQTGLKHVILSFVLAKDGSCDPAWGGTDPLDTPKASIDAFHAAGGSVTIATGGADGTYLEKACGSAADLAGAYTKILDATGTNLLDIDVEHDVQIDKVIDALSQVQRARGTDITLTLPVDLAGLGPGQLDLVRRAAAKNLAVTVNVMDMDFHADGNWGKAMVAAAETMLGQLRKVYPKASEAERSRKLGITIMIGRNDNGVVTQPADAKTVLDFAESRGIGRLGIWSLGRDRGSCAKRVAAQPDCSGIAQDDYQYTKQLSVFNGPTPA
jgi:chitinase